MSEDYLLGDFWAAAWRQFLAKRVADAALVAALFKLTANEYEKLADSFWILMAMAFAAGFFVWFRDFFAYWIAMMLGEDKRAPLSVLQALRNSRIKPEHVVPARIEGLKNLANSHSANADERVEAATIVAGLEGTIAGKPWFRREGARDLLNNAILRFTLEERRRNGLAHDDE